MGKQEKAEKASFDEMKENEALVTFWKSFLGFLSHWGFLKSPVAF